MKKIAALALGILFLLAGCGGGAKEQASSASQPQTAEKAPANVAAAPTTLTVTFSNASSYIFNEIYITPTASNEWGEDLLGSTSVLKSNGSLDIAVPAYDFENYDILVVDEDRDEYHFTRVPLQNGSEVAIYFGDDGLAADVYDQSGNTLASVAGALYGGDGQGDAVPQAAPAPTPTGTGHDTNGQYSFTVYNESPYDIYAIHMGGLGAAAEGDLDILPQVLPAGASTELVGAATQGDWGHTEWTLYITDVDGDTSASYDVFNPWTVSYVDVYWDDVDGGYYCEFFY